MTLRCPACSKVNDLAADATCQRCGCDLSILAAVLHSAARHLNASSTGFRSREWETALWPAEQSWSLYHTSAAAQFACLAAAALGDSERMLQWLPHAREKSEMKDRF